VAHGAKAVSVLALLAGAHGTEYASIIALEKLITGIDAKQLSGTVIIVPLLNVPSFQKIVPHLNPTDGKNMNRMYPGRPDGTQTDRASHLITTQVVEQSDHVIDFHGGDIDESLRPYSYWNQTGRGAQDAISKAMVLAFGLDHIVIDAAPITSREATQFVDMTALARGVPAITTETGQLGQNDERSIALAEHGIRNLMLHLGMLEGTPEANPSVVWLKDYQVIPSPVTGVFRATVRDGYAIAEGGLLGELYDPFGAKIGDVRAPFAGIVNYVVGTPPAVEGQPLAMVSRISPPP